MADLDVLAETFEEHRARLRSLAYRVLGSVSDADDAVQETWLRLSRSGTGDIQNLGGWLTTVTSRVALNMLESRNARHEDMDAEIPDVSAAGKPANSAGPEDPERAVLLGDEVGGALQVVLDTLTPRERLSFVLHDLFGVPFDEVAPVAGTTSAAARQLASRARRRVQSAGGTVTTEFAARRTRDTEIVAAFFAAAREARFADLLELLDPDVVMRADERAASLGAPVEAADADAVARWFNGRAQAARTAVIDGEAGAVWAVGGAIRVVFALMITGGRISRIELIAEPRHLAALDVAEITA